MASVTLRAEFSLFADNTVLGPSFTLNGFEFRDVAKPVSFVNESGGQKGLQFGHPGVQVQLPVETGLVNVRAAAFAGAFRILGRNAAGSTVAVETIPGDNTPHVVQLIHPGLASLDFRGGSNEGLIVEIWYTAEICEAKDDLAEPPMEFAGTVRDIDFTGNRTQILIGNDALLVADERLQRVLEAAFVAEREVRVEALDKQIQSVTIAQSPTTGCMDDGCVTELTCSPSCTATIAGRAKPVKSDDPRAIGVLLTAISDDRPVQQLDVDENDVIQRVKVNNSPPQV